jgi:prophage antirepressor-like protein
MSTELMKAFEFETQAVRVVERDGEPWFVAKDVALALGYPESTVDNAKRMTDHIPEEWKGRYPIPTPGGIEVFVSKPIPTVSAEE